MNDEIDEKQRFNATKEFLICIIDPEAEEKNISFMTHWAECLKCPLDTYIMHG